MEVHEGSVNRNGYFAQVMFDLYDIIDYNIQPVVKYESFDPNTDADSDASSIITFGVNYFFNDWTRLQINYLYKAEEIEVTNDEVLVQLQVKF